MDKFQKVYWLTGLAGAGKTTIGKVLYERLKETCPTVVFLDGDTLREVFGGIFGYSSEERLKCALCYARLCKMLSEQGMTVVCCTISMYNEVWEWNRKNLPGYLEVYIKVPAHVLQERDQKKLYSSQKRGLSSDLAGFDVHVDEPPMPDIIIENYGRLSVKECVDIILYGKSIALEGEVEDA